MASNPAEPWFFKNFGSRSNKLSPGLSGKFYLEIGFITVTKIFDFPAAVVELYHESKIINRSI